MFHNTRVTVFPEWKRPNLLQMTPAFGDEGCLEDFYGAITWTEPATIGEDPAQLVINTKAKRHTYDMPRLVEIRGHAILFQVLSPRAPSGTLQRLEKLYVVLREYYPA